MTKLHNLEASYVELRDDELDVVSGGFLASIRDIAQKILNSPNGGFFLGDALGQGQGAPLNTLIGQEVGAPEA